MKAVKGQKFSVAVLIFVAVTLVLYLIQSMYFDKTGVTETEFALKYTQQEVLSVEGFAVRDEYREADGVNTSVLYKSTDEVYVPAVSDSESVAVSDVIAVRFNSEAQADAYLELKELEKKKQELLHLKSFEELNRVNVVYLNSQIYKSVQDYVKCVATGDFSSLTLAQESFCNGITTKQIATGSSFDLDSLIKECDSEILRLESAIGNKSYVTSPYAGYFVSEADGYERTKLYGEVAKRNVMPGEASQLISATATRIGDAYGKIIAQHTWYMLFDISIEQSEPIVKGKTVHVDFPERNIFDIPMSVYDISDQKDGIITVTLKCKYLNEELAVLRKEKLSITIAEYDGYRISSQALVQNSEGIDGVYVLEGNVSSFTPVNVLYYGGDYVIAEKYTAYTTDEEGNRVVDKQKTSAYRELRAFDSIIVKGINIEDGKVVT